MGGSSSTMKRQKSSTTLQKHGPRRSNERDIYEFENNHETRRLQWNQDNQRTRNTPRWLSQTTEDGQQIMRTIYDPKEVEQRLINRNIEHFSQAHGTLFTNPEVIEMFGINGDSKATDDLINGNVPDISHLPAIVQQIIHKNAGQPPGETITTEVLLLLKSIFYCYTQIRSRPLFQRFQTVAASMIG
jgi:hypothetical protein